MADASERYWLFGGDDARHPLGGWSDFIGSHTSAESAQRAAQVFEPRLEWGQVFDSQMNEIVSHGFEVARLPSRAAQWTWKAGR